MMIGYRGQVISIRLLYPSPYREQPQESLGLYPFHLNWLQMIDVETQGNGNAEIDV